MATYAKIHTSGIQTLAATTEDTVTLSGGRRIVDIINLGVTAITVTYGEGGAATITAVGQAESYQVPAGAALTVERIHGSTASFYVNLYSAGTPSYIVQAYEG